MLSLLKIKNIALIDELSLEFGQGLNLLTGETGSGKSIIVDSLGALTGERVSSDLIKEGEGKAQIEGLFLLSANADLHEIFYESGVELEDSSEIDLIIRRELSGTGRNRIFVNNQLVTQGFLKKIGVVLGEIHGQGEQATLFNPTNHIEILDKYARVETERGEIAEKFREMGRIRRELENLQEDEAQKLQLLDILQFQIDEISKANLEADEDFELEEEKKRLNNVEKLSTLSDESYAILYENEDAIVGNLEKVIRKINELSGYASSFSEYKESLDTAQAVLEDLAFAVRDFGGSIEFSPERLEEIENRLAEISRLKRKYGGSVEAVLANLAEVEERLENITTAEFKEKELRQKLAKVRAEYIEAAKDLNNKREKAAKKFEKEIEKSLKTVALEKAKFVINFETPKESELKNSESDKPFTSKGFDQIEFYFSANPGQSPKPLAKVASGGEASRLMLILKTVAGINYPEKSVVFDEVDAGIGGRVAEAVGLKLKELSKTQQVLCVTHQPQVASLADHHFIVEKKSVGKNTEVGVRHLKENEQIEEIARMLAGEKITDAARQNAREMLRIGTRDKGQGTR
ncbi:MAG: DNA repair protein RecN [Acidobacteriota bacterium]|jgi:DNA repair protein RecN (Recombination protein N)|nr:DNA repair protein RecN [Acidobacteriota bacterium]